jgi:hypothetical protein
MSYLQTLVTVLAILLAVGAYLVSMYGIYEAQTGGQDEIDLTYIAVPSVLNSLITVYLLYYLVYIRSEKHTTPYKMIGITLLIAGLLSDVYFTMTDKELRGTKAATGLMYAVTTFNFIVRLYFVIQFQCSDVLARYVKPTQVESTKPPSQTQFQRPSRPDRPDVFPAIGGKTRR